MRLLLKEFQTDIVQELSDKLYRAAREVAQSQEPQAVGLSAPTGSGKTIMATAAMENLLQGDADNQPLSDAVFLWITDQPQLNEQTRRKMLKDSSLFTESNLVTIGTAFDQEIFTSGTVDFINIQKLGKERDLITKGDNRHYTIWDTIANTIQSIPDRFFVIIDEAHRGMAESSQARSEANTIIQKFIKGSPGEIPKVPLVLGISATLERFNKLVSGTGRTMRSIDVPVEQVRASGLIKDVVTLYHPTAKQPSDITMLREAARSWRKFRDEWARHCQEQGEIIVRPILVIQVQDAAARRISKTNLDEVVNAVEDELGGIPAASLAHSFQEATPIIINGKEVRYLAPPDIQDDPELQIVFFKTSLNTGWDCPRAEVMMSFRTALDATSIAQLVGRMVRNPLARRIESSDFLNSVSLYLPHYDEVGLSKVIDRLTSPDPYTLPPVEFRRGEDQITVARIPHPQGICKAIEQIPSYVIPSQRKISQVRRLMKLARALSNDEILPDAEDSAISQLMGELRDEYKRVQSSETFTKLVEERTEVLIRAVDWQVGLEAVEKATTIKLKLSNENIDDVFEESGRRIGDEGLHKAWWKLRRAQGIDNTRAKMELVVLAIDQAVRRRLEVKAQQKVQEWLQTHSTAISELPERRRQTYDEVRGQSIDPELHLPSFPTEMVVAKSDKTWKRHIYADNNGEYPATLNKWEAAVINDELRRDKTALWLRNIPRKPWSITIPYEVNGKPAPFYPDFIFVRKRDGKWIVDILDPHHIDLADAPAKAVGLAKYAAKHYPIFNRIELIIVRGEDDIRRINLADEAQREKVLAVKTKEHLSLLFDEMTDRKS
jgi:type III restriction enzyme